jgi:hypothetical protein
MKNLNQRINCGAALVLLVVGCSSDPRTYNEAESDAGAGGVIESGGAAGFGGSAAGFGGSSGSVGGSGAVGGDGNSGANGGADGTAAGSGSAGLGGGTAGSGGAGLGGSHTGCAKNSCCISGKTLAANAVDPLNVCQSCQPNSSVNDWSPRSGEVCREKAPEGVSPKSGTRFTRSCGESGCANTETPAASEESVRVASAQSGSSLRFDYGNLHPSPALNIAKATFRFFAKTSASARSLTIQASGDTEATCSIVVATAEYGSYECNVTAAVKRWIAGAALSDRYLHLSTPTQHHLGATVATASFANAAQRPTLSVEYSAACVVNACEKLVR